MSDEETDPAKAAALADTVISLYRPSRRQTSIPPGAVHVGVATTPQTMNGGASLANEVRLTKAALMYADAVTLYSPAAVMVAATEQLASAKTGTKLDFMERCLPHLSDDPAAIEAIRQFRDLKRDHRGRKRRIAYNRLKEELDELWESFQGISETIIESSGANELREPLK